MILVPFGARLLALEDAVFEQALREGARYLPPPSPPAAARDEILDAEAIAARTSIPASWFLEAARQDRIPYVKAGKYVRFVLSEVLVALKEARS